MATQRDTTIDSIKGILIILVVFGHSLEMTGFHHNNIVYLFIYSFHMPAFIFISGLMTKPKESTKFWEGIKNLLKVFVLFYLLGKLTEKGSFDLSINQLLSPPWTLWYILVLIFYRIIAHALKLYQKNLYLIISLSVISSLTIGYISSISSFLSIQRLFAFSPFFLMGYFANTDIIHHFRNKPNKYLAITIFTLSIFMCYIYPFPPYTIKLLSGNTPYASINMQASFLPLFRGIQILSATILSISLFSLTPNTKLLARIGKQSLGIYLFHIYILKTTIEIFHHYHIINNYIYTSLICIIIIAITYWLSQTRLGQIATKMSRV